MWWYAWELESRPEVQGKKQDPTSKITIAEKAGGMAEVVEHLPSKWSSTPVLGKKSCACTEPYRCFSLLLFPE
jgi:hypothetical protein